MPRSRDADQDPKVLRRNIERALRRDEAPADVLPMLERLQHIAVEGSEDRTFADRRLAEMLLESAPWRAALHIRRLVAAAPDDDATWALMGLAQALLGHYRYACASYRQALARAPGNPWYAHNLGHLLDVALDRPRDALAHLRRAHRDVADEPAITCSLVHALWRCGQLEEARTVLEPLVRRGGSDPDVTALALELARAEGQPTRRALGGPRRKAENKVVASLVGDAAEAAKLAPGRKATALRLLADYLREVRASGDSPVLAGASVLVVARVDGARALPYELVAAKLGVSVARLRARVRAMVSALRVAPGDRRYSARTERVTRTSRN